MFGRRKAAAKRFTLLLLEEEEDIVQDYVAFCRYELNACDAMLQRSKR
jgi:hypothetical protein